MRELAAADERAERRVVVPRVPRASTGPITGITPDITEVLDNGRQLDGRCPGPQALRVQAGETGRITVTCAVPSSLLADCSGVGGGGSVSSPKR